MDRLDNILSKVRGLVQMAEHPGTPENEANAFRAKADALMLQYAISQAQLRDSQPADKRLMPDKTRVDMCGSDSPYVKSFITLCGVINDHTRTKAVFYNAVMDEKLMAAYYKYKNRAPTVYADVYGFEGDLKYFEIMYTTLLLHMSNGIDPKPDQSLSDDVNSFNLRMAGLNWGEISRMYYRMGHPKGWDGSTETYMACSGYWKRVCNREARRRGVEKIHIPGKVTDAARVNWRLNFAQSYVSKIAQRLWIVRNNRASGADLILKSSFDAIDKMIKSDHPNVEGMDMKGDHVAYNEQAWAAGNHHATTVDLGGTAMGRRVAGEL